MRRKFVKSARNAARGRALAGRADYLYSMPPPSTPHSFVREPQSAKPAAPRALSEWATGARWIAAATAAVAWGGLALQYGLALQFRPQSPGLVTLNFLSFFTNLSNLLVAFCLTGSVLTRLAWVAASPVCGAAALYITVTGAVYSIMLRGLWTPHGAWLAADILLHDVVPALYLIWWLMTAPRARLSWSSPLIWLGFPVIYAAWTLAHGAMSGFYPYPFLNVRRLGLGAVLINMLVIGAAMLVLGYLLVVIDRVLPRLLRRAPAASPTEGA